MTKDNLTSYLQYRTRKKFVEKHFSVINVKPPKKIQYDKNDIFDQHRRLTIERLI